MIDISERLAAVTRRVGRRTSGADHEHVMTVVVDLPSSIEETWAACTRPERISAWFLPVEGDLREGGEYQLQGNASGVITRCDAPDGFGATWEFDGNATAIALRLERRSGGGTRLELDHVSDADDNTWALYGPGATGIGWDLTLLGLSLHLQPGGPADVAAAAAWATGEEGLRFTALLGEAWHQADVAGGADPGGARAAADRTIAAYTGAAPPAED